MAPKVPHRSATVTGTPGCWTGACRALPWVMVLCGACSSTPPVSCDPAPVVVLGTGVETFEPLSDGQELPIILGIQGGFHVVAALRVRTASESLKLTFHVAGNQGEAIVFPAGLSDTQTSTALMTPLASAAAPEGQDCWRQVLARRVFMPFVSNPTVGIVPTAQVDHQPIRLSVDVVDAAGRTAHASKTVIPMREEVGP